MNYTIQNLTESEVNLIATGLAELPWKVSNPLMEKLKAQVQAQEAQPDPMKDTPRLGDDARQDGDGSGLRVG